MAADLSFLENDNFRGEYLPLYRDVEADIRWASIALQKEPDAINLWIGNRHSTTALHRDNYENIYCQIVGSKNFVLLAPVEMACINEQFLPSAAYTADMSLIADDPPNKVPCALWDPDALQENTTRYSSLSRPIRVKLDPGDMCKALCCAKPPLSLSSPLLHANPQSLSVHSNLCLQRVTLTPNYASISTCMLVR